MPAISLLDIAKSDNQVIGASETNKVISKEFGIIKEDTMNLRIDIVVSSVTAATGITIKLQNKAQGGAYADLGSANASVSITGDGTFSIRLNKETAADLVDMPLRKSSRLVISTGAGDSVTIDEIRYQQ